MFGSRARGESEERSDVDLLVLHEGCEIQDPVLRRRHLYNRLREAIGEEFEDITVVDMELEHFLKPIEITALLLNVYWDAVVVYDNTGILNEFLSHIREKIVKSGLKRVKDGKAYRWVLPKPMMEIKIL
jgi:predicted nucleotidyltransferase